MKQSVFPNVFTNVLSFLVGRTTHMHAFFHSCKPLANVFVQVMVFYKTTCVSFKWTLMKPLHNLELFMAYYVALDITCPKQEPMKGVASFKGKNKLPLMVKPWWRMLGWTPHPWCQQWFCLSNQRNLVEHVIHSFNHANTCGILNFKNSNYYMDQMPMHDQ